MNMNASLQTVCFFFNKFQTIGPKPVLSDYSWWAALVVRIAPMADRFMLRCWPDEAQAIADGQRFGASTENPSTAELVFTGPFRDALFQHLQEVCRNSREGLPWFSLMFFRGEQLLCSSEHYGTELFLFDLTAQEADEWEQWSRQYPVISDMRRHEQE